MLRAGHKRWPIKIAVKNDAKLGKKINPDSGRMAEFYRCSICLGEFTNNNVEVDHVSPVVDPSVGFLDWNTYISRLFSSRENYQLVCKACHKIKTNNEKKIKVKENKNK